MKHQEIFIILTDGKQTSAGLSTKNVLKMEVTFNSAGRSCVELTPQPDGDYANITGMPTAEGGNC